MDLKDLKSAWNTYSSQEIDKHHLEKESINDLLRNKAKTLVDHIDRNIRIGMILLLAFIAYVILDSLYFSRFFIEQKINYPGWIYPLDVFSISLIIFTYLFFIIRYLKIKRNFSVDQHLKDFLIGILDTINTYRRMFYLAVAILLINMSVSFTAGVYEGLKINTGNMPGGIDNLPASKLLFIIGFGLVVLIVIVLITFFILRWGFKKLYGCYIVRLNETLKELDESGTGN